MSAEPLGLKHDSAKVPVQLLPVRPLVEVGQVLAFGAEKYGRENWCGGMEASRLYGAALRHMFAWWSGQDTDPETGLPHTAHALCCLLFLSDLRHTRPEGWQDDRPAGRIAKAFDDLG